MPTPGEESFELYDLALIGVPVSIADRATEWFDALIREFDIIASGDHADGPPGRLIDYVGQVRERFGRFSGQSEAAMEHAREDGRESVDQVLTLPVTAGEAASEMLDLVEEAVRYCHEGELLTLAAPDDVMRFTRWYLTEVARQSAGADPRPWPGPGTAPDQGKTG